MSQNPVVSTWTITIPAAPTEDDELLDICEMMNEAHSGVGVSIVVVTRITTSVPDGSRVAREAVYAAEQRVLDKFPHRTFDFHCFTSDYDE